MVNLPNISDSIIILIQNTNWNRKQHKIIIESFKKIDYPKQAPCCIWETKVCIY